MHTKYVFILNEKQTAYLRFQIDRGTLAKLNTLVRNAIINISKEIRKLGFY